ncbi:unnamed protein product, partial [marine sediment metagenome]
MIKLIHGMFEQTPAANIGEIDLIIIDAPDNIGLKYQDFNDNQPEEEYK